MLANEAKTPEERFRAWAHCSAVANKLAALRSLRFSTPLCVCNSVQFCLSSPSRILRSDEQKGEASVNTASQ